MTEKREQVIKGEGWGINGDENRLEFYVLCRVYNLPRQLGIKSQPPQTPFPWRQRREMIGMCGEQNPEGLCYKHLSQAVVG